MIYLENTVKQDVKLILIMEYSNCLHKIKIQN